MKQMPMKSKLRFFQICTYNPIINESSYLRVYLFRTHGISSMLLDELFFIQENFNNTLSFMRSCREGIFGSCAMNINDINRLASIYRMRNNLQN